MKTIFPYRVHVARSIVRLSQSTLVDIIQTFGTERCLQYKTFNLYEEIQKQFSDLIAALKQPNTDPNNCKIGQHLKYNFEQ